MSAKKIFLHPKKASAIERFHPWVFSGAIERVEGDPRDGDLVGVFNHKGEQLATGHYQEGSITVRIIEFGATEAGPPFWVEKLEKALDYRRRLGLVDSAATNCYRLVHAEGDGLPGLIVDVYDRSAVIQCHSIGMYRQREQITQALVEIYGGRLEAVYDKSRETLPGGFAEQVTNGYLYGLSSQKSAREYGHEFVVDWETGQKTGFFVDQRENRRLLATYAKDRHVLNAFCYSGGFSVYALASGARHVDSVDVSGKAIALTDRNIGLNPPCGGTHQSYTEDVLRFLQHSQPVYDLMIIDPPAFAKSLKKRHNAVQGYKRLNALAMQRIHPGGGILFTFSCSQVVDKALFYNTIVAAALEAGRKARVMHQLSQPPDHPVSLFHPEGEYLKGLVVFVE